MVEWFREEWERARGELAGRVTHSEGIFPFIRILSNVVVRELQTMAILLDVYLGVPVIYSTFMQYDELAHHFGPSSKQALVDLRRTDARIAEIWRMARLAGGRAVRPGDSFRSRDDTFRELPREVRRVTRSYCAAVLAEEALISHSERSEYADLSAELVETVAQATPPTMATVLRGLHRRSRLGSQSLWAEGDNSFPEKYRVDTAGTTSS